MAPYFIYTLVYPLPFRMISHQMWPAGGPTYTKPYC